MIRNLIMWGERNPFWLVLVILLILVVHAVPAHASDDPRYCGVPKRDAAGKIVRSKSAIAEFRSWHACPSTGSKTGSCPGWQINHTIPLDCGGCDTAANMDWMPVDTKTCSGEHCRDRYERKIYAHDPPFNGTHNCTLEVVK